MGSGHKYCKNTALALCYSIAEYVASVWARSCHAKKVDIALNETCRIISRCLKATLIEKIQVLLGVAPPDIKRDVASEIERYKQLNDPRVLVRTHCYHDLNPEKVFLVRFNQ